MIDPPAWTRSLLQHPGPSPISAPRCSAQRQWWAVVTAKHRLFKNHDPLRLRDISKNTVQEKLNGTTMLLRRSTPGYLHEGEPKRPPPCPRPRVLCRIAHGSEGGKRPERALMDGRVNKTRSIRATEDDSAIKGMNF